MFPQSARLLWLAASLLLLTPLTAPASTMPETFVPRDEEQTLLEVRGREDAALQALREDRQKLLEQPDNLSLALDVARRAIQQGRTEDDPRFFGYAEGALSYWWDMNEPPLQVRVLRATIFQHRHRFSAALQDLGQVLERDPDHAQARLTRAVIHTVQGRYEAALKDCDRLSRLGLRFTAMACSATPASLSGSARETFSSLQQLPLEDIDLNTRIWLLTIKAEIAERLGREDTESHYREALAANGERPDLYLSNAYADWLLDQGRPREVLSLLEKFADSDGSLLRLALARHQLAEQDHQLTKKNQTQLREALEADRRELRARFAAERERGGAVHQREAAMFQLYLQDNPQQALWLARDNFRNQREPLDARILLESALAAEAPEQALPAVHWMRDNDITDVRLAPLVERTEARVATQPTPNSAGDRP